MVGAVTVRTVVTVATSVAVMRTTLHMHYLESFWLLCNIDITFSIL